MTKAVIYARFSPRPGAATCESIDTQREACIAYCAGKAYTVAEFHGDKAVSGSDEDRPVLWDAVNALRRGYVLVVYSADRLARSVYLAEYIRRKVDAKGARIECVRGDNNGTTPEDVLVRQVMQAFAEYERKIIAARTRLAMRRHQQTGRRMSRIAPYGYRVDGKRLVEDPAEQAIIVRVAGLHAAGMGLADIRRQLKGLGIVDRRGQEFSYQLLGRVLERCGTGSPTISVSA